MYSYEFPVPYEEMMWYSVICIICLTGAGWVIKKTLRNVICPHLIPVCLVVLSFIISNLYQGGWEALITPNINDIRAITNGLAAVGLYQLIVKTYTHFRYKHLGKTGKYKKGKKIAS